LPPYSVYSAHRPLLSQSCVIHSNQLHHHDTGELPHRPTTRDAHPKCRRNTARLSWRERAMKLTLFAQARSFPALQPAITHHAIVATSPPPPNRARQTVLPPRCLPAASLRTSSRSSPEQRHQIPASIPTLLSNQRHNTLAAVLPCDAP
jgi:hypothetical protein